MIRIPTMAVVAMLAGLAGGVAPARAQAPECGGIFDIVGDAPISMRSPGDNYGSDPLLSVAGDPHAREWWLLAGFYFDDRLPARAHITEARLEFEVYAVRSAPWMLRALDVTQSWDEMSVTFDTRPSVGAVELMAGSGLESGIVSLDVTALVQSWVSDGRLEGSILLKPAEVDSAAVFLSRETGRGARLHVACVAAPQPVQLVSTSPAKDDAQLSGLARLRDASRGPAEVRIERGAVVFSRFKVQTPPYSDPVDRARWFLHNYADLLYLDNPDVDLQLLRRSEDGLHLFFRQRYRDVPVVPGEVAVHLEDDHVVGVSGRYATDLDQDTTPMIDAARATAVAIAQAGSGASSLVEPQLRFVQPALTGAPDGPVRLAWQVAIAGGLQGNAIVFVDARDGELFHRRPVMQDAFDLTLNTGAGAPPMGGGANICWWPTGADTEWFTENGQRAGTSPDAEGFAAFASAGAIDGFWRGTLGRDGHNGGGGQQAYYLDVLFANANGTPAPNAWFNGFCNILEFHNNASTIDIMGHEFTHGVVTSTANLDYCNQPGALNESYGDIFGYMVDPGDWTIGEGSSIPGIRDMSNPPAAGHPDHMAAAISGDTSGFRANTSPCDALANDYGFVHTNSGIHNKVAFLLIDGGTHNGVTVTPLGRSKAARLFYDTLRKRLRSNSSFMDARNETILEAATSPLFAPGDACQVNNAFASVGLGSVDSDCDGIPDVSDPDTDGDGVANSSDNCPTAPNGGQADADGDAQGNACDIDDDNDFIADPGDNCPLVQNTGQGNWDGDQWGDHCDDSDFDGVTDNRDNCRTVPNQSQANLDHDSLGDSCDADADGDGAPNGSDNCGGIPNNQQDLDGDGMGDICDTCPQLPPPADHDDRDGDGLGNDCDSDNDNDGVADGSDNCPEVYNPAQTDFDFNGDGTGCDLFETQQIYEDPSFWHFERYIVFDPVQPIPVPLPVCPRCGDESLPGGFTQFLDLRMDVPFRARLMDADGIGGDIALDEDFRHELRMTPKPFGISRFDYGPPGGKPAGPAAAAGPATMRPDQTRYTLLLMPGDGVAPGDLHSIVMQISACADADADGYYTHDGPRCAQLGPADCDDTSSLVNPGRLEVCDGLDNNCDGSVDNAVPPAAPMEISTGVDTIYWPFIPGATHFDVIQGDLATLAATGGDFSAATSACLYNDVFSTAVYALVQPGPGAGFFYLVRPANCGGAGTWESGSMSQMGTRSAEIAASPNACP